MKKENTFLRATSLFIKITAITAMLFILAVNPAFADYDEPNFQATGGGNGPVFDSLSIFNENLTYITANTARLTWETDKPATSRVMYGFESQKVMNVLDVSDVNRGYDFSTPQDDRLVTNHVVIITNLNPDTQYFFRPESRVNNYARVGSEKTTFQYPAGVTGGEPLSCNYYLSSYLRMGDDNDVGEVKKLQTFLKDFEGFTNLEVIGVFNQATFDAVSSFQLKYAEDVLVPWGIDSPTGYVYYTTQKKINEIYCGSKLSLTESQLNEINKTKVLIEKSKSNGQYPNIDFETIGHDGSDDEDGDEESMQASVGEVKTGVIRSIFSTIRGWFSRD
ncbi:fibronectin type III domain-containing protein [Patescibacteria group bacterium]